MRRYEDILSIAINIARFLKKVLGEYYIIVIDILSEKARNISPTKMFRLADTFVLIGFYDRNVDLPNISRFDVKLGLKKLGRWMAIVHRDYRSRYEEFINTLRYVAT